MIWKTLLAIRPFSVFLSPHLSFYFACGLSTKLHALLGLASCWLAKIFIHFITPVLMLITFLNIFYHVVLKVYCCILKAGPYSFLSRVLLIRDLLPSKVIAVNSLRSSGGKSCCQVCAGLRILFYESLASITVFRNYQKCSFNNFNSCGKVIFFCVCNMFYRGLASRYALLSQEHT